MLSKQSLQKCFEPGVKLGGETLFATPFVDGVKVWTDHDYEMARHTPHTVVKRIRLPAEDLLRLSSCNFGF